MYIYTMKEVFYIKTPIGTLQITQLHGNVCSISLCNVQCASVLLTPLQQMVKSEIEGYFAGKVHKFSFPVSMEGTPFQLRVWEELIRIPFGSTATYGDIAGRIGAPKASRAVGMACNRNPLLLAVPCHRVVGAGGKLTGFAVGIEKKKFLLELEKKQKTTGI